MKLKIQKILPNLILPNLTLHCLTLPLIFRWLLFGPKFRLWMGLTNLRKIIGFKKPYLTSSNNFFFFLNRNWTNIFARSRWMKRRCCVHLCTKSKIISTSLTWIIPNWQAIMIETQTQLSFQKFSFFSIFLFFFLFQLFST